MPLQTRELTEETAARMETRLWAKAEAVGECLEWTGARNSAGYGHLKDGKTSFSAHRVAWVATNGEIPPGAFVCHHCDNPSCIRPDHLFVGTHADNQRDKAHKGRSAKNRGGADAKAARTHCPAGHLFDEANTYWWGNSRHCRACRTANSKRSRAAA